MIARVTGLLLVLLGGCGPACAAPPTGLAMLCTLEHARIMVAQLHGVKWYPPPRNHLFPQDVAEVPELLRHEHHGAIKLAEPCHRVRGNGRRLLHWLQDPVPPAHAVR